MQILLVDMLSDYFNALAHATRIDILRLLRGRQKMCVCEIVQKLGKEQSNVSRHLNVLKRAGIISSYQEGVRTIYHIEDTRVHKILEQVEAILQRQLQQKKKIFSEV